MNMNSQNIITIAIDCMGGDFGTSMTIPAAINFLQNSQHQNVNLLLIGQENVINESLQKFCDKNILQKFLDENLIKIIHAEQVVAMDDSPTLCIRNKKNSSMRIAINAVKDKIANACVSAGNTGALMATSHFVLKMLPNIERPAICGAIPTTVPDKCSFMLDLGANVDCNEHHLYQFAKMGTAWARAVGQIENPKVALLNIGSEEIKGNNVVKNATKLLKDDPNFVGNIEGDAIYHGEIDVIVCDGFVGNVALKTSEGLVQTLAAALKQEYKRTLISKFGAALSLPALKRFKNRFDHRRYNGAILLGLQGISIKSHGSADVVAFEHAIEHAYIAAKNDILQKIQNLI